MKIRGAPAIGIAAAYGIVLALENFLEQEIDSPYRYFFDQNEEVKQFKNSSVKIGDMRKVTLEASHVLEQTRPTAVNLFWAIGRMRSVIGDESITQPLSMARRLFKEAVDIYYQELDQEFAIGEYGATLIENGMNILTHCNAGGLATAGYGTALGVLYRAQEMGKKFSVFADETRPLLQGARLTAWEMSQRDIPVTVLCESAHPSLFAADMVDAVIVGADRIAANGDVVNKVGTLGLAVMCEKYGKPFYVAAPSSTIDFSIERGDQIPIEIRPDEEVTFYNGKRTAPPSAGVYNPAFDCTPAELINAIITESCVITNPSRNDIKSMLEGNS
jgi:methylthioribose-1-phosphate isomerase